MGKEEKVTMFCLIYRPNMNTGYFQIRKHHPIWDLPYISKSGIKDGD